METNDPKNQMWETAKARVAFRRSLLAYVVVNTMLVAIWYVTSGFHTGRNFWPIWPMLGWGIGLVFQYASAYHGNKYFSVEKEYEKMKQENH